MNSNIQMFVKRANKEAKKVPPSLVRESLKSIGASLIPLPTAVKGTIAGYLERDGSREAASYIPGGLSYNWSKRIQNQVKEQEARALKKKLQSRARTNAAGEILGSATSMTLPTLLTTGIGAGIGALAVDDGYRCGGALVGSIVGSLAGLGITATTNLVGALAAAITRRRTAEEQMQHDMSNHASNWIVPGVSTYNYYKRLGRSQGDLEEGLYEYK